MNLRSPIFFGTRVCKRTMSDIAALERKVKDLELKIKEIEKSKGKRVKRAPTKWNIFLGEFSKKNQGKIPNNEMMAAASKAFHAK